MPILSASWGRPTNSFASKSLGGMAWAGIAQPRKAQWGVTPLEAGTVKQEALCMTSLETLALHGQENCSGSNTMLRNCYAWVKLRLPPPTQFLAKLTMPVSHERRMRTVRNSSTSEEGGNSAL